MSAPENAWQEFARSRSPREHLAAMPGPGGTRRASADDFGLTGPPRRTIECRQAAPDPVQPVREIRQRLGVAGPNVVSPHTPEGRAREDTDAGLAKQQIGQLGARETSPGHVRKGIEGP